MDIADSERELMKKDSGRGIRRCGPQAMKSVLANIED